MGQFLLALKFLFLIFAMFGWMIAAFGLMFWRLNPRHDLVALVTRPWSETIFRIQIFWYSRMYSDEFQLQRGAFLWGIGILAVAGSLVFLVGDIEIWLRCKDESDVLACWIHNWPDLNFKRRD